MRTVHHAEASSSDECCVLPPAQVFCRPASSSGKHPWAPQALHGYPDRPGNLLPMVEEVSRTFEHPVWVEAEVAATSAAVDAHLRASEASSSSWLRSASASSSQSQGSMDLSKLVFSGLEEQDQDLLLPGDDNSCMQGQLQYSALRRQGTEGPSSRSGLPPTVNQIWGASQRRLEGLLSRVIVAEPAAGAPGSPPPATQIWAEKGSPAAAASDSLSPLACLQKPALARGRLEGLLSEALDSVACHKATQGRAPSVPQKEPVKPLHALEMAGLGARSSKRIKVESDVAATPSFAPASSGATRLGHAASGTSWHSVGQASHGVGPSDEDDSSPWEDAAPKDWSVDEKPVAEGSRKRAHVGKKRVASERNRRSKIREGLHQLREVMHGQNDYAATLMEAVSYIQSLQAQIQELKSQSNKAA